MATPELVLQVVEAAEDYRITRAEFAGIMDTITSIFMGVAITGLAGILLGAIAKSFAREQEG